MTEKTFPALMTELVLSKSGMSESTYGNPLPAKLSGTAASGYRRDGAVVPGRFHTYPGNGGCGVVDHAVGLDALWNRNTEVARGHLR